MWTRITSQATNGAVYDSGPAEPAQSPRSTYATPHKVESHGAGHTGVWHTAQMWLGLSTSPTKAEAAEMLSGPSCAAGSFLLRSQRGGAGLALSVLSSNGRVVHYRIDADGGMYTLLDTRYVDLCSRILDQHVYCLALGLSHRAEPAQWCVFLGIIPWDHFLPHANRSLWIDVVPC